MPFILLIIFGTLASCFALIVELGIFSFGSIADISFSPLQFASISSLLIVAIIEETFKYLCLGQFKKHFPQVNFSIRSRILWYGIIFGIGFALPESMMSFTFTVNMPIFFPLLGVVFLHLFTSALLALGVLSEKKTIFFPSAFFLISAVVIHFVYNLTISRLL